MRGLSLRQPWASAVAHGGKRLENRGPRGWTHLERGIAGLGAIAGQVIAIHASVSTPTTSDLLGVSNAIGRPVPADWEIGGSIVATARVVDVMRKVGPDQIPHVGRGYLWRLRDDDRARLVDRLGERVAVEQIHRWWIGAYALVLEDVVALPEPVAHRGALGFWQVEGSKVKELEAQIGRAA